MKKSDLKTGMWAILRNGKRGMVLLGTKDEDIISGDTTWSPLSSYDDNLLNEDSNYDIVQIIQPSANCYYYNIERDSDELIIWRRNLEEDKLKNIIVSLENELNKAKTDLDELQANRKTEKEFPF